MARTGLAEVGDFIEEDIPFFINVKCGLARTHRQKCAVSLLDDETIGQQTGERIVKIEIYRYTHPVDQIRLYGPVNFGKIAAIGGFFGEHSIEKNILLDLLFGGSVG